jgi:diguanylate cyclase (GGDEF)-like protein
MSGLGKFKLLLAIVILLFVAAAAYIWTLVVQRQTALEKVSRYNVVWLVSQATTEYARLEQRISAFGLAGGDVETDEVQLRFDIVVNRMKLLETGDVVEFLDTDPEHQATVAELERVMTAAQPLMESIERPGSVPRLLELLTPLDAKLARLAAAANRFGGDRVADDQRQLIRLHWQFSAMAAGLIVCGVILIALLLWHNKLLALAHGELNVLAGGMRTQNQRFDAALNNMSQGLCMVDLRQQLIVCNDRYRDLFGLAPEVVTPGTPMRELFGRISAGEGGDFVLGAMLARQQPLIKERRTATYFQELADGRTFAISHQPMTDGGWVATYEDISERRRAEERIAHMTRHDPLTDLPNRLLLREQMEEAFARARRHGSSFTILCIDLDGFKRVNDTLGHSLGDALLKAAAERIRSCIGEKDIAARLGGDEFAILQVETAEPRHADMLARRVLEVIAAPYDLGGQHVVVDAGIGLAVAPRDGTDADQLLKNADLALYRAKSDCRGTYCFFEPQMDAELQTRRVLEMDLRKALASGEFELWYQPLVDLATGRTTGCETLIRWRHPERGIVSPAEFIPLAEEIGLIIPIGEWLLRQACMQAARWPSSLKIAVNLSPLQLKSRNLLQTVILALASSGLPATRLELEITETVLMQDNEVTLSILHELRGLGVRIAMDDFGTGYSSLSYLRSFPFDKIKLDQSFVRDLAKRPDCKAIVQSIAMLGSSLGMTTTAEGIETAEQFVMLKDAGFVEGQGFYFGRPQPAAELTLPHGDVVPRAA